MRSLRPVHLLIIAALLGFLAPLAAAPAPAGAYPVQGSYKGLPIQNCADPAIANVKGSDGLTHWYMYCTADPLNDNNKTRSGGA